jgi:hypothetical protein
MTKNTKMGHKQSKKPVAPQGIEFYCVSALVHYLARKYSGSAENTESETYKNIILRKASH